MFTSPVVEVKELAADFLFVLCKSNGTEIILDKLLLLRATLYYDVLAVTTEHSAVHFRPPTGQL